MKKEITDPHLQEEFGRLIEQHKETIYTACYIFADDKETAEDLFQDALLNLWRGYADFQGRSSAGTWIWRVSLNTCITYDRKRTRAPVILPLDPGINLYENTDDESRQINLLHKRIHRLGMLDRAIVLLWLEDLSYEEIGEITGISPKNVSVRLVRIREKLKNMK